MQSYIYWALFGMVGYSVTTLFTKLAERSGDVYSFVVLAVSTIIVPTFVLSIVAIRGELKPLIYDLEKGTFLWAVAAACAHRGGDVAVPCAVARAGQCGGADLRDVLVGGSLLGVLFLGEPMTSNKIVGLAAAVFGVMLVSI
jgi:transporter family protein